MIFESPCVIDILSITIPSAASSLNVVNSGWIVATVSFKRSLIVIFTSTVFELPFAFVAVAKSVYRSCVSASN